MNKKLGILIIRGSGDSGFKRQEKFFDKVFKKLEKNGVNTDNIECEFVDWYEHLQNRQELIISRMENAGVKLKGKLVRNLILTNIGDLINYGGKPNLPNSNYEATHQLVYQAIQNLQGKLETNAPLIIVASSMGTEIINNYIWDRQNATSPDPMGTTPFERFESLVGFFNFGHNIPIFAASNNIDSLQPISFPPSTLDAKFLPLAVWENYYDKNDPMGYPVKLLNTNYQNSAIEDIGINAGSIFIRWNLLSHFGYWKSGKIRKRLVDYITDICKIL
ncbi:MAG: hypothetical protein MI922_10970 [Bacteroidales bacterium]|nr:hypothetical protein [Bacteroidales bacterium]